MPNPNTKKKSKDSIASVIQALAFSPWLIIIYFLVSGYVSTLSDIDQGTIKSFIEWFGTAYSLFLALVLVNVWAQFETIDREFDLEIDALATLYNTVRSTELPSRRPASQRENFLNVKIDILNNIKEYIHHVKKNYSQEHSIPQQRRNGDIFLETIDASISSLAFSKDFPDAITSQFFDSLNQAMDVRGDRIAHCKQRTRGVVLLVAYVASLVWLLSFFGIIISSPWVASVLIGGATFIIVMVLTIISDLDKPFDGAWQVELDGWDELSELIEPGVEIILIYKVNNTIEDEYEHLTGKKVCQLRSLSRTGWGRGWKEFLNKRLDQKFEEPSRTFYHNVLFLNQLDPYAKHIEKLLEPEKKLEMPMVISKQGDKFQILMYSTEISDCSDLNKFETVLTQKIKAYFPWYCDN